jgi:6-phosphogluconolactonase (cycloisomerase 2 family)
MSESKLTIVGCYTTEQRKARGKALKVYRYSASGWERLSELAGIVNPSFQTVDPVRNIVYSVHGDSEFASAYSLDPETGGIEALGEAAAGGKNGVALAVCPNAPYVFVSNYSSGSVASLPIAKDGGLRDAAYVLELPGEPGPHRKEQPFSHPHDAVIDPDGNYLIVPDKGLDRVFVIAWNIKTGEPRVVSSVRMRPGAGPRHLKFHPTQPYAYVANEIDSTVCSLAWDAASGEFVTKRVISTLPDDFFLHSTTAEIVVEPSGRYLYVSNRGLDALARFAIDPADPSRLTLLGWTSSQGSEPRFMTLSPDGSRMVVANEQGDNIVEFDIDASSGDLSLARQIQTESPCSIVFK